MRLLLEVTHFVIIIGFVEVAMLRQFCNILTVHIIVIYGAVLTTGRAFIVIVIALLCAGH